MYLLFFERNIVVFIIIVLIRIKVTKEQKTGITNTKETEIAKNYYFRLTFVTTLPVMSYLSKYNINGI